MARRENAIGWEFTHGIKTQAAIFNNWAVDAVCRVASRTPFPSIVASAILMQSVVANSISQRSQQMLRIEQKAPRKHSSPITNV